MWSLMYIWEVRIFWNIVGFFILSKWRIGRLKFLPLGPWSLNTFEIWDRWFQRSIWKTEFACYVVYMSGVLVFCFQVRDLWNGSIRVMLFICNLVEIVHTCCSTKNCRILELFIIYVYWIYFLNVLADHTYRYSFLKSCDWLKLEHRFSSDIHWLFFQMSFVFFIFTMMCNAYYNFRNYILKSAIYLPVIKKNR